MRPAPAGGLRRNLRRTHFREQATMGTGRLGLAGISAWRANDVVAYEAMRESATTLSALLLRASGGDPTAPSSFEAEVKTLRDAVLSVDGYDRAAVSALATRIHDRIAELTEPRS